MEWSTILFLGTLVMIIIIVYKYFNPRQREYFSQKAPFILRQDNEKYDTFYLDYYDELYSTESYSKHDIDIIINTTSPNRNSVFLDIGCGTAVLAMAVAKASSAKIMASDVDPVAVEVALANLKANNLENRVDCIEAMGFEDFRIKSRGPYDLIFANILKRPLIDLAPDISGHMSSGGLAIISGILDEQAEEIIDFYQQNGLVVFDRIDIGEWVTLTVASGK